MVAGHSQKKHEMKRIIVCLLLGGLALSAFCETKVKFDGNGGKATSAIQTFVDGEEYNEVPNAERKGFMFAGWWTEKTGGERFPDSGEFDASLFAGQSAPTLYARWLAIVKLTLKDDSAYAYWDAGESFDYEIADWIFINRPDLFSGELEGKGTIEVLQGMQVNVSVDNYTYDRKDNELSFQKWTVSPSGTDMGGDFLVTSHETEFTMPDVAVTLQATYIDESVCGWLSGYANAHIVGINEDTSIEPPYDAFQWSPDGGKTWYKVTYGKQEWVEDEYWDEELQEWVEDGHWDYVTVEELAMLKAGKYTITWRSTDPDWQAPAKSAAMVYAGYEDSTSSGSFTYIPSVVIDVMTIKDGECTESSAGGAATMSAKDGRAVGKAITFTAKAAKNYVFQGWAFGSEWEGVESPLAANTASWKVEGSEGDGVAWELYDYINPDDLKVHVVAVFKALSDYSADDIEFKYLTSKIGMGYSAKKGDGDSVSVDVRGVVGCSLEYSLRCGVAAYPLSYKLGGKLPAGLKFDAKTGVLSGVPTKPGKATVTIAATDPAKHSKSLAVNIDISALPAWLVGDYRGMMDSNRYYEDGHWEWDETVQDDVWVWDGLVVVKGPKKGALELSVTSAGKVSAKVLTKYGSRSASGNLVWNDPKAEHFEGECDGEDCEEELPEAEFVFDHYVEKDESECYVEFLKDGTIEGYADSYDKSDRSWAGGDLTGMRHDKDLLEKSASAFLDKYYTFAFYSETEAPADDDGYDDYYGDGDGDGDDDPVAKTIKSGYGYLTLKTDKKGVAKVVGQLPDGEKVSVSALLMPVVDDEESSPDDISARLYVFASPSSYKKAGWFAMSLSVKSDGTISSDEGGAWIVPGVSGVSTRSICGPVVEEPDAAVWGLGALYSAAASLENYYWTVLCDYSEEVVQEYSWKETCVDGYGGGDGASGCGTSSSWTEYDYAKAWDFDDLFFNVTVVGDKKGAIGLAQKSPAPWYDKSGDEWNYWEDKKGNVITDPSQLSISFAKATGIFTGKASVYFDYEEPRFNSRTKEYDYTMKHVTATMPYAGVMVREEYDGEVSYTGYGSAVYSYKLTTTDANGKAKAETKKVTLPVALEPADKPEPSEP